jgi:peptide/nickel transport system permease protein
MATANFATIDEVLPPSAGSLLRRRIFGHTTFLIGAVILLLIIAMAIFAPLLAPHDPYAQSLAHRLVPPFWHAKGSWLHPLGTDQVGRDYLSRLIYGSRISLFVGFSIMIMSGLIGTTLGLLAGYFGGRTDLVINFIITTRLALPVILVALTVAALAGSSLTNVILVLGLLLWDRFAVVTRSATMQIRSLDYVAAAQAIGSSTWQMVATEILPNVLNAVIIIATIEMANGILLAAALSFLGLGIPPPLPDWGAMIADGKLYMFFSAWLITIPGVALFLLVLSINLLGDGLRDLTAPENRS